MSGRDRDRDRDRAARSHASTAARTNEYFVPRDGIDREVITADICRYLGNDALVRPGVYENPSTGVAQPGFFINAYRNLTTAMIADLKADSERWDAERRQAATTRGQPSNVEYRSSTTHQSRQYYGPSEAAPVASQAYAAAATYASAGPSASRGTYDGGYQTAQYAVPQPVYATDPAYAGQSEYYVSGADLTVDGTGRAPVPPSGTVPRTGQVQYQGSYPQADTRGYAYPGQTAPSPVAYAQGSSQQPTDTFYGRAPPATGTYESATGVYDSRGYQDQGAYSQAQVPNTTSSSGSSRRDRERESERDSRHHRSSRR